MLRLLGFLLALASLPILFLNEGRAVRTARSLEEGAGVVFHVPAVPVQPANDGKLVHFTGAAETTARLRDPIFGVEAKALQLSRKVEMYQWKRNYPRGRAGDSQALPGDYEKVWAEEILTTGSRNLPGYENPSAMPYRAETLSARDARVGDFQIPQRVIAGLDGAFVPLALDEKTVAALPNPAASSQAGREPMLERDALYFGKDAAEPQVGDVRVRFLTKGLSDLSVVGRQRGNTIEPYPTKAGRDVEMARVGAVDARDMFEGAMTANTVLTWVLRITGYGLMLLGTFLVLRVRGLLRWIPLFGSALGFGAGALAFVLATAGSLVVIALAWVAYRPAFALLLLLLSGAIGGSVLWLRRRPPGHTSAV